MSDCIFCKIVAGELPSHKIYEDESVVAFLDIQPVRPGHALIVPKVHSDNLLEMGDQEVGPLYNGVCRVARAVVAATDSEGCNVSANVGRAAGQVVFHTHIHVIPRREGDGLTTWPKVKVSEEEMGQIAEDIRQAL